VGNFDTTFEWTYNRDVDYCLSGRKNGFSIYQIPVRLFHHESRDTKRIKDKSKAAMEMRNLERLQTKWANSKFYKTLDKEIKSE
jgi:GT2 family glycosyltransferase